MNQITLNGQTVKVGDVFVYSWGYEQTNINFSKIVSFTPSGKSARIVSIGHIVHEKINDMVEKVMPDIDNVTSEPKMVRMGTWRDKIEAGRSNWKWDGQPEMETSYA